VEGEQLVTKYELSGLTRMLFCAKPRLSLMTLDHYPLSAFIELSL
jgi:hypothetical protein